MAAPTETWMDLSISRMRSQVCTLPTVRRTRTLKSIFGFYPRNNPRFPGQVNKENPGTSTPRKHQLHWTGLFYKYTRLQSTSHALDLSLLIHTTSFYKSAIKLAPAISFSKIWPSMKDLNRRYFFVMILLWSQDCIQNRSIEKGEIKQSKDSLCWAAGFV